jgi:peptide subunit release factor 1 (eRF1)
MDKKLRRAKHTISQIRAAFKKAGCDLLTKEYRTSKQRLHYLCKKCGKKSMTCWNNFSRGYRCKECSIRSKLKEVPKRIILRDAIYSLAEVARILNVVYSDLRKHVQTWKTLPSPSKRLGAKMYFTQEDLDKIESLIE